MATQSITQLIDTPSGGKIEVEALWQSANPTEPVTQVAVICHPNPLSEGDMHNKVVTTMFRFARDAGMHAVRFNFRGVGQSTGVYGDTVGEIEDAVTVLKWVAQQTQAQELWLGGFSFSGYIAMRVATLVESDESNVADFHLTDLALVAPSIEKHDISNISLPTAKTFCIYGDKDELVKPISLQAFVQSRKIRYQEVAETGHFFHGKLSELKQGLKSFTQPKS